MDKVFKNFLIVFLALLLVAPFLNFVSAQSVTINNPLTSNTFTELLNKIIDFIFYVCVYGVAPLMIVIAGFMFIMAQGDPAKVQKARDMVLWTLIGVLVIFLSKALIKFLQDNFMNS